MGARGRPPGRRNRIGGSPEDRAELEMAAAMARAYYLDDRSKVAIASDFGVSRHQVARLLEKARQAGVVRIEILLPGDTDDRLALDVREALGVPRVVVARRSGTGLDDVVARVGQVLAEVVSDTVTTDDVLGLSWSRAIESMARQMTYLARCMVVQVAGFSHAPGDFLGTVEIVRALTALGGGPASAIYAPLVVGDAQTAATLRQQPEIASALARNDGLDVAVMSVGAWQPGASTVYDALTAEDRRTGDESGACGEVSGRVFDENGRLVRGFLDDRVLGITMEQMRRTPEVIVSSHGSHRCAATVAAVRAGLVKTLVIDDELAESIVGAFGAGSGDHLRRP